MLDATACTVSDTEEEHSLQLYDRLEVNQQKFYLEELSGSAWRLSVLSSGEAVTCSFEQSTDGTDSADNAGNAVTGSVQLSELIPDSSASTRGIQAFTLTDAGDGCFYIQASDGSYLTVNSTFAHRGSSLVLKGFTGRANQKWRFAKTWVSDTDNADTDLSNPYAKGSIYEDFVLAIRTDKVTSELTAETAAAWVSVSDDHELVYDEDALNDWVLELAEQYNTLENGREFTTSSGETITITEGTYGWSMDADATAERILDLLKKGGSGRVLTEAVWTQTGEAFTAGGDIGDSYIEVDLTNQKVWFYRDGELLGESDCVSGDYYDDDCRTPEGIYTIYYMKSPATLRGADYVSEVDYFMAYYGNYGLHDASWRSEFGGDIYLTDGSHGCVNLPDEMAQLLYENVYYGYVVVTYY
ncbi:MAG: L,D-transpeptidase family protein [Clostridiales bacterium]|nr:L,D-transpeptidase family protein [Clostridiales bacterium]